MLNGDLNCLGVFMLIGYALVSTDHQNLDLQKDALTRTGFERILEDRLSGARAGS